MSVSSTSGETEGSSIDFLPASNNPLVNMA